MMKVLKTTARCMAFIVAMAASISTTAFANTKNSLGLWLEGGASSFLDNMDQTKNAFGGGGAFGVGYELQHKRFLFDLGVEFQYASTSITMNPITEGPINMIDDDPMNTPELRRYNGYFEFVKRNDIANLNRFRICCPTEN
jgi:hypothetical protein